MVQKMVIVIGEGLDVGQGGNVIGLLGISLGHHMAGIVGPDVVDSDGSVHAGMSTLGLPVLVAVEATLHEIRAAAARYPELRVFDVTDAATRSRDYATYTARLQDPGTEWVVLGLALVGSRPEVDALTGRLGLLR